MFLCNVAATGVAFDLQQQTKKLFCKLFFLCSFLQINSTNFSTEELDIHPKPPTPNTPE